MWGLPTLWLGLPTCHIRSPKGSQFFFLGSSLVIIILLYLNDLLSLFSFLKGVCRKQQRKLEKAIKISQRLGEKNYNQINVSISYHAHTDNDDDDDGRAGGGGDDMMMNYYVSIKMTFHVYSGHD